MHRTHTVVGATGVPARQPRNGAFSDEEPWVP